jgi:hypothetical protein
VLGYVIIPGMRSEAGRYIMINRLIGRGGQQVAVAVVIGLFAWANDLGVFTTVASIVIAVFMLAVLQTGERCLEKLTAINEKLDRPI